ncbi:glycoside hydrolase family 3 N-terminal domain-containing protein [Dysgonomonas sp. 511]|uniref:glycoside hydrolase family 3 N-terminal domain-containing protein n=1 Tax=Dysgonomonas sp. 511 TaxID=2302930 RepID=UPI0013CF584A|nr:glycoside hydrolase family 3 N-terminal domain-containing protein [Dysgonomonas sp. 511]NDV79196.1 glycoside hydrolase [Dysgonomonas sp. 511]
MKIKYIPLLALTAFTFCTNSSAQNKKTVPNLYKSVNRSQMTKWVDSVYNQMSTDQRIGQLFIPLAFGNDTESNRKSIISLVQKQHIGGLLFSKSTPAAQANLTNVAQKAAKVPLMITLDGEWGLAMRLSGTTRFPRNMTLGAIQNDSLLYYYGKEVARQCKLMGIHVNFAPALDVNSNPANPVIGTRSFGEDPQRVARLGIMYSKGLEAGGVMSVAKHFPGHGDTSTDSHKVLPLISHNRERLDKVELKPFKEYINAGLSGMMVGHLNIPALEPKAQPSSLSAKVATGLLQDELGFTGLIFTDGLQMKGVSVEDNYCVRALLAGNDLLLGPVSVVKEYNAVKQAVADGTISQSMLEQKCKKVLAYKYILGVHKTKPVDTKTLVKNLNTPQADHVNRQLSKAAVTLLKDSENIIPFKELDKRKIAAVALGEGANNEFHKRLKNYGDVTCFTAANANALLQLKNQLSKYNTVIVSVHSTKISADTAIRTVTQGKETVLAFFVVPYRMSAFGNSIKASDAVVLGYEGNEYSYDYTAQTLFGGYAPSGKIPVSVKGLFEAGKGLAKKKTRLAYDIPESLGIPSDRFSPVDSIIEEGLKEKAYPGAQLLVAKNGVIIYNKSYGSFEYDGKRKVDNDDIYDIASMTKAIATVPAVMKLYDQSKLKLNTPISTYVDPLKGTDKARITIREALLHETAMPPFIPYYMNAIDKSSYEGNLFSRVKTASHKAQFDETTWARTDYKFKPEMVSVAAKKGFVPLADKMFINKNYQDTIIQAIADANLRKRKTYLYSCLNFILLQKTVEKIARQDLNAFTQKYFFLPLGATTTTYTPLQKFDTSRIVPTEKDDFLRKQLIRGYVHDEGAAFMGGISGNAGLFSNANDLAKLCQMLLNKGTYGGEKYLSEQTCTYFTSAKSTTSRRGLGFDKPEPRTNKSSPTSISTPNSAYGHTGFTGTCFWIDPDNNLIYILLTNRVHEKRTNKGLTSLGIRHRVQEEIYKTIRKNKTGVAIKKSPAKKKSNASKRKKKR